jgi:tetratricopeptide (TPR) repeat protein
MNSRAPTPNSTEATMNRPARRALRPLFPPLLVPLLWIGLATLPAAAQKSDAEARADIELARGLAADWGFVDLSQEVISQLRTQGVSRKLADELALIECEIYSIAGLANPARRDELLKQSITCYEDFLARNAYSDQKGPAEARLVSVSGKYARSLALKLEDAAPDQAAALRTEMQSVLQNAILKTGELVDALRSIPEEDRTESDKRRLFELLLDKGDMLLELAKSQEDGTYSFEQSYKAYESLIDVAGEATPYGLLGAIGIGDNYSARERWSDAADFYEFVVELAIPSDAVQWTEAKSEMTLEEQERRFYFVQRGIPGLVRALANGGKPGKAAEAGLRFYNLWKREGYNLPPVHGDLALLAVARTLVDAGGWIGGNWTAGEARWFPTQEAMVQVETNRRNQRRSLDVALELAQTVYRANQGNTLQIRAQRVISEVISRPGISVDPEVLFQAAQGEFYERNYPEAISAMKRVLAALESADEAKRTELGSNVLWHIGRSFIFLDRPLEAAAAFQEAVGERWVGDPQRDIDDATKFYETVKVLQRQSKADPYIDSLYKEAEQAVQRFNASGAGEIAYRNADKLYAAADADKSPEKFAEAKAAFARVPADADSYEKALVYVGVCEYQLGNYEAAQKVFDQYLNVRLKDSTYVPRDGTRQRRRLEATAAATFYWGLSAYKQEDWKRTIELFGDFPKRFPDQTLMAPAALYRVMIAHGKLEDQKAVTRVFEQLLRDFPASKFTAAAAVDSYKMLRERRDKLLERAGAEQDPEPKAALEAQARTVLRDMAENLQVANRNATTPSFNNMRAESKHWVELGEWETAEELLRRIHASEEFRQDPKTAEDLESYVVPDLGKVLVQLHKVREAAELLKPLVESKKANTETAQNYARALAGWIEVARDEGGRSSIVEVPGVGGEASFEAAWPIFDQLATRIGRDASWEPPWYEHKIDLIYTYYRWSQIDAKRREVAERMMSGELQPALGSQFDQGSKEKLPTEEQKLKLLWLRDKLES